jgi:tripartite-type tricarboxylate transporter receptor subunit TctC
MRLAAVVLACALPLASLAQTYPTKPVRLILTNPPGGTVDTLARVIGDELGKSFGQPFVLENRPGANGSIGGQIVATAEPDGHTLLLGPPGPIAINRLLFTKMPYDPRTAFAPVSLVAVAPLVFVVNPNLSAQSFSAFLAQARAQPGKLTYASQGNGSSGHLAMELLKSMTGIDIAHVPYKGSAPALADLIAGRVDVMLDNTTSSLPQVRAGKLRALAVAEPKRIKAAPDLPTIAESGLPGFEATPWFGIVARAGTPKPIIDQLAERIGEIVRRPDIESRFAALGVELRGTSAAAFDAHIAAELTKWDAIVKRSGAKLD